MTHVAMCPRCNEPLVCTLAFAKFEFYCLSCGGHLGWLDPRPADETPELLERMEAVLVEFKTLSDGLIIEGREQYAKPERLAAHEAAIERIRGRITVKGRRA